MNKGRQMASEWKFRREDYKKIKQMDRRQLEIFCKSLYEQGQESVKSQSLNVEEIREVISKVKGIGEKRTNEIIAALEGRANGTEVEHD